MHKRHITVGEATKYIENVLPVHDLLTNYIDGYFTMRVNWDELEDFMNREEHKTETSYPVKIVRNGPAVIVFWSNGDKTVVKKMDSDEMDVYAAVAQAMMKTLCGSTHKFHKVVDRLLVVQDEDIKSVMPKPTKDIGTIADTFNNIASVGQEI